MKISYEVGDVAYFEFNQHDYYALISVKKLQRSEDPFIKSHKVYLKCVGGESFTGIMAEGSPTALSEEEALFKCLTAKGNSDRTARDIMDCFYKSVDVPILIDGALI